MDKITRRSFIRQSATVAAGVSVAAALTSSSTRARPAGANNDIRIAVVGLGGQGRYHVKTYNAMKGVRVVALCDPDRNRMQEANELKNRQGMTDAFERFQAHLDANEIDISKEKATLGPLLRMDPDAEEFTGRRASEANRMLTKRYRKGFLIESAATLG